MADKKSNLSEQEKEEMKALQDMRRLAGEGGKDRVQFTDSQRIRLSELQNKEQSGAAETGATTKKEEPASSSSSSSSTPTGTGGALGKK